MLKMIPNLQFKKRKTYWVILEWVLIVIMLPLIFFITYDDSIKSYFTEPLMMLEDGEAFIDVERGFQIKVTSNNWSQIPRSTSLRSSSNNKNRTHTRKIQQKNLGG